MTIHWKAVEQYFTVVLFVILENLSILDLALSGVKGLKQDKPATTTTINHTYFGSGRCHLGDNNYFNMHYALVNLWHCHF